MPSLDDAARIEVERLCDAAVGVIEANRGVRSAGDPPDPDVHAALDAITARLVAAGVERGVAERAVTRWYVTRARGGGRVSIVECVAVELDPPYRTGRQRPGTSGPGVDSQPSIAVHTLQGVDTSDLTGAYERFAEQLIDGLRGVVDPVERFHAALALAKEGRRLEGLLADARGAAVRELQARDLSLADISALIGVTRARVQQLSTRGV